MHRAPRARKARRREEPRHHPGRPRIADGHVWWILIPFLKDSATTGIKGLGRGRRAVYFLRWRILARIRRFLRPIFRRPFPVFFVPNAYSSKWLALSSPERAQLPNQASLISLADFGLRHQATAGGCAIDCSNRYSTWTPRPVRGHGFRRACVLGQRGPHTADGRGPGRGGPYSSAWPRPRRSPCP